jgi:hypothetical protein
MNTTDPNDWADKIFQAGIIQTVIQTKLYLIPEYKVPTIRILGNFLSFDDSYPDKLIQLGSINVLSELIKDPIRDIKTQACWALSNLTSGTKQQVLEVIKHPEIIYTLVNIMRTESDLKAKKEAIYALSNACGRAVDFEAYVDLVRSKVLEVFNENISVIADPFMISCSLNALKSIFESGEVIKKVNKINPFAKKFEELGGVSRLEALQRHPNPQIYKNSVNLVEIYF